MVRLCVFLFFLVSVWIVSDSSSVSDDLKFINRASNGRNLLQAKKACPINFEIQNYKIITDKCKGPNYPANQCCSAFKEFACPFVSEINDVTNVCASTMFNYINLQGKYPAGLFANECFEGKNGLACIAQPPSSNDDHGNGVITQLPSSSSLLISSFLVLAAFLPF